MAEHLLVIDDDTRLVEMLAAWMDGAGVRVTARHDVRSGLHRRRRQFGGVTAPLGDKHRAFAPTFGQECLDHSRHFDPLPHRARFGIIDEANVQTRGGNFTEPSRP